MHKSRHYKRTFGILTKKSLYKSVGNTSAVAGPKWNQASLSYLSVSNVVENDDITGIGFSGTKLLGSNFFVGGSYSSYTLNTFDAFGLEIDQDLNFLSLGLGVRKAVAGNTDLYGMVSYENTEAALSSGTASEAIDDINGYSVKAGIRSMVSPKIELGAVISYTEYDNDSESGISATGYGVTAAYHFNQFSLGAGYSTAEDEDTMSLTGSLNF